MSSPDQILEFKRSNFNRVAATMGGFLSLFGLISFLMKEKFYMSEALISMVAGLVFSPHGTNWIRPQEFALHSQENLESITLYFTRLVLGVQLVLAGIQLPSRYLRTDWKPLAMLLGPGMCAMWILTSLLVWALVPQLPFLHALAVAACVTPTDPVLSNSIVKGKFADAHVPPDLQNIIVAESGANDGLGYPFLFLALYLIKYYSQGGAGESGGAGKAIGYWFGITWGYEIIMSTLYGGLVGFVFRHALKWAEKRKYVDRESFIVFAITIALFIVGTLGMIGSDDVLACFVAGNLFSWDGWFREETQNDYFQPTIDMILNVSIFAWYGAICPWYMFVHNHGVLPIYRLIFLGILVMLFRRLPMVFLFQKQIPQMKTHRHLLFMGYFGPIGVSAIFYLYTSREFLRTITVGEGSQERTREDAEKLEEIILLVVWFLVMCSIIVHGLSVPVGKLGVNLPRVTSQAVSSNSKSASSNSDRTLEDGTGVKQPLSRARTWTGRLIGRRGREGANDETTTANETGEKPSSYPGQGLAISNRDEVAVNGAAAHRRSELDDGVPMKNKELPTFPLNADHKDRGFNKDEYVSSTTKNNKLAPPGMNDRSSSSPGSSAPDSADTRSEKRAIRFPDDDDDDDEEEEEEEEKKEEEERGSKVR